MERLTTHFEVAVPPPFVLPEGAKSIRDVGILVDLDGHWRAPGGSMCTHGKLFGRMSLVEQVSYLYAWRDVMGADTLDADQHMLLEEYEHAARNAHYAQLCARQTASREGPHAKARRIWLGSGLTDGSIIAKVYKKKLWSAGAATAPSVVGCSFGVEVDASRVPVRPFPLVGDYVQTMPYQHTRQSLYTHLLPTEKAIPMVERIEEHFERFQQMMQEVDPEWHITTMGAGWLRQTHSVVNQPRSKMWPGLYGLLYFTKGLADRSLERQGFRHQTVYFDDLAWELHIGYGDKGDVLGAVVYLTPDGEFICSTACQNELAQNNFEQPLVGKLNAYTLQSWLASAGIYKRVGAGGGTPLVNPEVMPKKYREGVKAVSISKVPAWYSNPEKVEAALRFAEYVQSCGRETDCTNDATSGRHPVRSLLIYQTHDPDTIRVAMHLRTRGVIWQFLMTDLGKPTQRVRLWHGDDLPPDPYHPMTRPSSYRWHTCPIWVEDAVRLLANLNPRNSTHVEKFEPSERATLGTATTATTTTALLDAFKETP